MPEDSYTWEEKWHTDMDIDHFSFGDRRTFNLRYLINTQYWDRENSGPVFLYCGNEMAIEGFANNTGFMWDEAPKFNAMLLFVEHRYYGKSLPFGDESGTSLQNLQHLSSAQALADFAEVIYRLKEEIPGMAKSPVIAFGGSYGAMLSAWMRIKYPHVVVGAISSSGPILQFPGQAPCWTYTAKVTKDYAATGHRADDTVRRSWPAMRRLAQTENGRAYLNKIFNVCEKDKLTKAEDVDFIIGEVTGAFGNMAMLNYPYPTFFVKPLPTYPVQYSAKFLAYNEAATDEQLAFGMQQAMNTFTNYTGQLKCMPRGADDSQFGFWPYQCCTDLALPHCSRKDIEMFEEEVWDEKANGDACAAQYWGTRPRYDWAMHNYGNDRLTWATNIVFINGDMDPWEGGGVIKAYPGMDSSIHIINIKHAAHHLEMRAEHPMDPIWTRNARVEIRQVLHEWVQYRF